MSIATDFAAYMRTYEWPSRFTDSCTVKRVATNVLNQSTGVYDRTYTTNYTGVCLVRPVSASEVVAGQELVATHGYYVYVPFAEPDPLPEDLVDITAAVDAFLVGKQFVVKNVEGDGYAGKRTLLCEEVVSG